MSDARNGQTLRPSDSTSTSDFLTRNTARATVILTGIRAPVALIPIGVMAGVATAPMWIPSLRRYRGAIALAVTSLLAVVWGVALTAWQAPYNGGTSLPILIVFSLMPIAILCSFGAILWAREHLSERTVGIAAGAGLLLTDALNGSITASVNPWKFGLALPVSIILLSITGGFRRWQISFFAFLLLGAANAMLDSRSAFATCALSALLFLAQRQWQKKSGGSVRARAISLLLTATAAAAALYQVTSHLLTAGYLGEDAQQRSVAQLELSGSIIVGGRPEMAAAWALMRHRPAGFGAGAIASTEDVMVAKSGMWAINYQPDNGYVERYMFGSGIKLHSIIGDMWAYFGFAGLFLAFLIAIVLVHALFVRLATGTASGVIILLVCTSLWNIPFGPLFSATPILGITLGLALLPQDFTTPAREIIADRWTRRRHTLQQNRFKTDSSREVGHS